MKKIVLRIPLAFILSLFPLLFNIQNLKAEEWYTPDDLRVEAFYGRSKWTAVGPDPNYDYTWANISLVAGKEILSWLDINAGLGPGYIDFDSRGSTPSLEFRLLGHFHHKYFYFNLGAGLAYLFDRDNLPELGDSELYCLVSASAGVEIFRLDDEYHNLYLRTGYRVEHMSSIFHNASDGDIGLNLGAIELALGWDF